MKPTFRLPSDRLPLLAGALLALAFHGLWIASLQIKGHQQRSPVPLPVRDNTSELLQWGSQSIQPAPLAGLPLPKARVLPPPSAKVQAAPQASSGVRKKVNKRLPSRKQHASFLGQGNVQLAPRPPRIASRSEASAGASPVVSGIPADWPLALERLHRFQLRLQSAAQSSEPEASNKPEDLQEKDLSDPLVLRNLNPSQQKAYQSLWKRGQVPSRFPWRTARPDREILSTEVRFMPLDQRWPENLQIRHQQIVLMEDHFLLLWLDQRKLWLFRSSLPRVPL